MLMAPDLSPDAGGEYGTCCMASGYSGPDKLGGVTGGLVNFAGGWVEQGKTALSDREALSADAAADPSHSPSFVEKGGDPEDPL